MYKHGVENTAKVKQTELNEEVQRLAESTYNAARFKNQNDTDVAYELKNAFDAKEGGVWHCVIGNDFGCEIAHMAGSFTYFEVGKKAVILFRTQ
ncbi:unnamed protein product [Calicophoron daubneyi]|uniref:Dynein light chain n=1 Tax=Calicophoron daubneyi TaxID=300641 RepID=A0AAV2T1V5_CALDB